MFVAINKLATVPAQIKFARDCRSVPVSVDETSWFEVTEVNFLLEKLLYINISGCRVVIKFPQLCTWLIPD